MPFNEIPGPTPPQQNRPLPPIIYPASRPEAPTPGAQLEAKVEQLMHELKTAQRPTTAFIAGLVTMLLGSVIWAAISVSSNYQIGYMAIGVGLLVGLAVKKTGHGISTSYGVMSAALALAGCVVGNLFTLIAFAAKQANVGVFEVLPDLNLAAIPQVMMETAKPIDILF